jgi:predicted Zn-dependent peptidase
MVVVLAGDVNLNAFNDVEKYFGNFSNSLATSLPKIEIILNKNKLKNIKKEVEQDHFAMAVPAIKRNDERIYAFKLLTLILNGNSSSRLFQKIREDKALAYYIDSVSEVFEESGFWGVQSGVTKGKLDEVVEIVRNELRNIGNDLSESELSRAKDCLIGTTKLMMDRSAYWSTYYGRKLLLEKKMETIDEGLIKYQKTTLNELKGLAKSIFIDKEIRIISIKKG